MASILIVSAGYGLTAFADGWSSDLEWPMLSAPVQDNPMKALRDEYAQLERMGLKENFHRLLSFTMLQQYLPAGTRMTSGYRSAEKQLDLIQRMARAHNIPSPDYARINDEKSWRPALMALRAKGFIIAAPTNTPHASDEAVFDLSGSDLHAIEAGLRSAEKAGMVKFGRIIFERQNNAVHVEVAWTSPRALKALGERRLPQEAGSIESSDEERESLLEKLQTMHDSEPNPAKKSDYDRSMKNLLDAALDSARVAALEAEIERHQEEVDPLETHSDTREAIGRVSEALRKGRIEDAERGAEKLVNDFPDAIEVQDLAVKIRTARLMDDARRALKRGDCNACEEADRAIRTAIELSPQNTGAQSVRKDIDACLEQCGRRRSSVLAMILGVMVIVLAASITISYWSRRRGNISRGNPYKWVLEGIGGTCKGQIFPLEKEELIIGSQGRPGERADIVISDDHGKISRRHCIVMQNGKQFYLLNESTNEIKINDREIEKGVLAEFHEGDEIYLGREAVLMLTQLRQS